MSFRDALRIDECEIFDDLMDQCKLRASATSATTRSTVTESYVHDYAILAS